VGNWVVVTVALLAILIVLFSLAIVDARMLPASPRRRSVLVSFACAGTGALSWLVFAPILSPEVVGPLFLPVAALGGLAAYLATIAVRALGGGVVASIVFGLVWSILVFVPTAFALFAPYAANLPLGLQPVDHGGSLVINVAPGAAALAVLAAGGARARAVSVHLPTATIAMVTLCVGWLAWLVSAELAIDEVLLPILINGLVGTSGGVVGWLVVQRIRHQSTTLSAVAAGLISGLVAVTAGAPLFTPVSAFAAGVLAGGAACIFTLLRVGSTRRQQWFVVGSHLIAGALGIVVLGMLANDSGFLFTGSIALILNQVVAAGFVTVYSAVVSVLLWLPLRRLSASGILARRA
jgi:ammonia channel protein AmtB